MLVNNLYLVQIKNTQKKIQISLEADLSHSYNGINALGTIVTDTSSPGLPITIVHGGDSGNQQHQQSTSTNQQSGTTTNNGGGASPDSSLIVLQPTSTATYSSMLPSFSHYATGKCDLSNDSGSRRTAITILYSAQYTTDFKRILSTFGG